MKKQKTKPLSFADVVYEAYKSRKSALNEREADVVAKYYGLGQSRRHTLQEIGNFYSITRERVRQIKFVALTKLGVSS